MNEPFQTERIAGVRVSNLKADTLVRLAGEDIAAGRTAAIVAINPEKIMTAKTDTALARALEGFEYPIADGIGVVRASKKRGGCISERCCGIDAMSELCALAAKQGIPVFLYGAAEGVAKRAADVLAERYSGLVVAGTQNGYDLSAEHSFQLINSSGAKLAFIALGSPKQELFIERCRRTAKGIVFIGVGGAFDVVSGNIRRAPAFFRKCGLEWLWRLLIEPSRLRRQIKLFHFLHELK